PPTGASPTVEDAPDMTRGEFLQRLGWSAAAMPFILTGYGVYRTVYDFAVRQVDVSVAGLPRAFEGLRIAQLSDLHAGSLFSERPMRDAVAIVNELRPDLIALTGDYVNHDTAEMARVLPAMHDMHAEVGIFGCLGNHDHYADTDHLGAQLRETPVDLLVNTHRTLEVDGALLHVIGTDNTGFRQHYGDLPRAVEGIPAREGADRENAQILLAHDPTFWDLEVRPDYADIDLMLCGHTHGGQFGFEFGPIRWSLAQLRYERWGGLYSEPRADGRGSQFLYVNRGLGTVGPPLRLGIRPEITLLTLRRA
ncbi:MAG: metallophosphoesterase, partial [Rhodothermales bacterium]